MSDHFHPCTNCDQPCECINDLDEQPPGVFCLGCGRKECPGNADDPMVQGREDD